MNWALIIFGAGLVASAMAYMLRLVVFDRLDKMEAAMGKAIDSVKADAKESAKDQGKRIGDIETDLGGLLKWQAKVEGGDERERDLSGVVRR